MAVGSESADDVVIIMLPGLDKSLRVFHLSDSHIDKGTDLGFEGNSMNFGEAMHLEYVDGKPDRKTGEIIKPSAVFEAQVALAKTERADLIVHTGNLLNFPSFRAAYYVQQVLDDAAVPYMYTTGNHDWTWAEMAGAASPNHFRKIYCWAEESTLSPLFLGREPANSSKLISGIWFVAIDNSTHYILDEQLAFFQGTAEAAAEAGEPVVLLLHIPLFSSAMHVRRPVSPAQCETQPRLSV